MDPIELEGWTLRPIAGGIDEGGEGAADAGAGPEGDASPTDTGAGAPEGDTPSDAGAERAEGADKGAPADSRQPDGPSVTHVGPNMLWRSPIGAIGPRDPKRRARGYAIRPGWGT